MAAVMRAGRTHDLVVQAGNVTAKVTGSRPKPYMVTIALAKLDDAAWERAIAVLAAKAQFAAELLAGEMPREIDAAFAEIGSSLFPIKASDLATRCSCPDWANPCKHVAATHYVLGEALDRDPFLLFELRGRTKERLLDALRMARAVSAGDGEANAGGRRAAARVENLPGVLPKLDPTDYDRSPAQLPSLHLRFESPLPVSGLLDQLGKPPGWGADAAPNQLLGPMIRRAADKARSLAMAERPRGSEPNSLEAPEQG